MLRDTGRAPYARIVSAAYVAIVALAAGLRYVGLDFSPSTPWGRPDEEIFAQIGLRLFGGDDPHVAEGGWPELWFRAHHWMQALLLDTWAHRDGTAAHLGCVFALAPWRLLLPMRIVAATLSVLTVVLVMRLGFVAAPRRSTTNERHAIALLGGLFYAVNVLAMRDAHFAVSDQPLLFFATWMFLAAVRGVERGKAWDFLTCGLALGWAIGTKWAGLPLAIVPVIALGVRIKRTGLVPRNVVALLLGIVGFAFAFILTNRTFLEDPARFLQGVQSVALRYDPNAPRAFSIYAQAPIMFGIERHAIVSYPFALGWPLALIAYAGCVFFVGRGTRAGLGPFLMGFWSLFFHCAVVGRTTLYFARYSLLAHPTGCVVAAIAITMFVSRVYARGWLDRLRAVSPYPRAAMLGALVLLVATEPTFRSIEMVAAMRSPETRERALAWLHQHAGNDPVDMVGGYSRPLALDPAVADRCEAILPHAVSGWAPRIQLHQGSRGYVSESPASWHGFTAEVVGLGLVYGQPPAITARWAVVADPYLPCDQPISRFGGYDPPASCYREAARFEPVGVECDAVWDDQDHFYAPLWGFDHTSVWSMATPHIGPRIVIYERTCP